jgi:hypothetical protein
MVASAMSLIRLASLLALTSAAVAADTPLMLDLSPHFWETFVTPTRTNESFLTILGRREFDGIPFQIDGRACLYGKTQGSYGNNKPSDYPDMLGVPVGRAFDELHLLHATQWSDVEGMTIAHVRLNYADGTKHEFPIRYGAQVRDWQRLQSEEQEIITDPDTKVIWRGPGIPHFKSTQRMFKSLLRNPHPEKVVTTLDFVSTGQIASYDIAAATVANRDPSRPVSPHVPLPDPARNFDGRVLVKVEDESGLPIEDVWIYPNISVPDTGWATVATPFYTAPDGTGTSRYPRARSTCIVFNARKDGWRSISETVRFAPGGGLPNGIVVTIRMAPIPGEVALHHPAAAPSIEVTAVASPPVATAGAAAPPIPTEVVEIIGTPAPAAAGGAVDFKPHPILIIDFPTGSIVRVETAAALTAQTWTLLTTITNLPFSPYPFICCNDVSAEPQGFFRAVLEPQPLTEMR